MDKSEGLDRLTSTFSADRSFCNALVATPAVWQVAKLLIYARWAQKYMNPIQEELYRMAERHFPPPSRERAAFWTIALTGGIFKDVCLVPYLVVRGLISEGGYAVRRSLEHIGVLTHLWHGPEKAAYLEDPEAQGFRSAFIKEPDRQKADDLKRAGLQKRFAQCILGKPASDLYKIFSSYTVHGGSPKQLVMGDLRPTSFSCGFLNRPDPQEKNLTKEVELLSQACELLCVEVVFVHGTFGKKYSVTPSPGGEGGFFLTQLLDGAENHESEMSKLIRSTLKEFNWASGEGH